MPARVNEYATALGRGNYYGEDAELLSISAAVARIEGTVGLIDAANEATISLVMQKLEVIITSQAALSASLATLATRQAGLKRDLEAAAADDAAAAFE